MGTAVFSYVHEEYDDGDVYIPRREVEFMLTDDRAETLDSLVSSFQEYIQAIGFTYAQSRQIELKSYNAEEEG